MTGLPAVTVKEECVLRQLSQGQKYGLELVTHSHGLLKRNEVHVLLARMERKNFIMRGYLFDPPPGERGPARQRYLIASDGHRALAAFAAWNAATGREVRKPDRRVGDRRAERRRQDDKTKARLR